MAAVNPLMQVDAVAPTSRAAMVRIARMGDSERFRTLDRLEQYYEGKQHSHKRFNWDGTMARVGDGPSGGNPGADWDILPGHYVPLKARRPSTPYQLARVIVDRFTGLLFSEGRWPKVLVPGDDVAQDFAQTVVETSTMRSAMVQARKYGGSMGSAGISYKWLDGRPRVEVHNPKHIFVSEWADREEMIPATVIKTYKFPVDEWDAKDLKFKRVWYIYYREWTTEQEVRYKPVRDQKDREPELLVDAQVTHGLGFCPFVWIQNIPCDEVDGVPDYSEALLPVFDQIDTLNSSTMTGTIANVDPTLVLRVDPALLREGGVKKGSDHAINVGRDGDARYLELAGTSIEIANRMLEANRKYALEVAQCVLADPDKISGAAQSAKAIEFLYAPMLSKADVLREQWGRSVRRIVDGLRASARKVGGEFRLPPRQFDPAPGVTEYVARDNPGGDADCELGWGPYFDLTPQDEEQEVRVAQAAAGGAQVISQETALQKVAAIFGVKDLGQELEKIKAEESKRSAARESMFGQAPGDPLKPPGGPTDSDEPEDEEEEEGSATGEQPDDGTEPGDAP